MDCAPVRLVYRFVLLSIYIYYVRPEPSVDTARSVSGVPRNDGGLAAIEHLPVRRSRAYKRDYNVRRGNDDYREDNQNDDYRNDNDDDDYDHEHMKAISQPKVDYWAGYYDFLINEGSYKFWAVFQLATAALLIYSGFAALYYAKVNPPTSDDLDDIFRRRRRRRRRHVLPARNGPFAGLDSVTFQRIIEAADSSSRMTTKSDYALD